MDVCSSLAEDGDADADDPELVEPDDPELLQPTASSPTASPAVAVTVIRPRRGDLIDAPNVDNGGEAVAWSIGAGGQRPALKLAPQRQCSLPIAAGLTRRSNEQ